MASLWYFVEVRTFQESFEFVCHLDSYISILRNDKQWSHQAIMLPQTMISNLNQFSHQPTFKYAASTSSDIELKPEFSSMPLRRRDKGSSSIPPCVSTTSLSKSFLLFAINVVSKVMAHHQRHCKFPSYR